MKKHLFKVISLAIVISFPCNVNASSSSRISDIPIQPSYEGYERTAPLFELGQPFLDTGNIDPGFEIPTGAVWQPQFLIFGDMRTAFQHFDANGAQTTEWANRLNLFGQLKLTGTERFLIGMRPLDKDGNFSGKTFEPNRDDNDETNLQIRTFYFEGELGEIFPTLDPTDTNKLDWGFSVGRQPILVQEGLLINDTIDAFGVVRNSITLPDFGIANLRMTGLYSWDEIQRDANQDDSGKLFALLSEFDTYCCTVDVDLVYVDSNSGNDGYFAGVSSVQRMGHWNTSFRALHSEALNGNTTAVSTGTLLFAETSTTPTGTHDNLYINGFVGFDQFSSAARSPAAGGPLGRTGILYAAVGLGQYGAALSNRADDAYGASIGYQKFMSGHRQQLILEVGGRQSTTIGDDQALAVAARFQQAFGKHTILVLDGFIIDSGLNGTGSGVRTELRWKF